MGLVKRIARITGLDRALWDDDGCGGSTRNLGTFVLRVIALDEGKFCPMWSHRCSIVNGATTPLATLALAQRRASELLREHIAERRRALAAERVVLDEAEAALNALEGETDA